MTITQELEALLAGCTPAPWQQKHRKGLDENYRTEVFSEVHGGIATCRWTPQNLGSGVTGTYRKANAKLIAQAPTLAAELIKERANSAVLLSALQLAIKETSGATRAVAYSAIKQAGEQV